MRRILVTGATGFVGSELRRTLAAAGDEVVRLTRTPAGPSDLVWNPATGSIDAGALEDFEAVVHLAGENIAGGRWTAARKQRLVASRVAATRLLAETLLATRRPPRVFVAASATGCYGNRGDEVLDELSSPGTGFLAELCHAWEAASEPLRTRGVRVVQLRIGLVLGAGGGALPRMLLPFRLGLGGRLGDGHQWWSWIGIDDLVAAILFVLDHATLEGAINATAPRPVTNREFTACLARVLRRPAILPAPACALRLLFGEMADALLLASARVLPRRLQAGGFEFLQPDLEAALRSAIRR